MKVEKAKGKKRRSGKKEKKVEKAKGKKRSVRRKRDGC